MEKLPVGQEQFTNLLTTVENHLKRIKGETVGETSTSAERVRTEMRNILTSGASTQIAFVRAYVTSRLQRANADQTPTNVISKAPTGALLAALFVEGFDLVRDPFNHATSNIEASVKDALAVRLLEASPIQIESTIETAGNLGYLPRSAQSNLVVNGKIIDTLIDIRAAERKKTGLLPACGDLVIGANNYPGEKDDDPWIMCGKYEYQVPKTVGSKEMRNKTVILIARPGDQKYITGMRLAIAEMPVESDAQLVLVQRKVRDSFEGRYESFDSEFVFREKQGLPLDGGN